MTSLRWLLSLGSLRRGRVLSAAELDQIHRANRGRTRIHAIEFGQGEALPQAPMNFLQKLAVQSGGTYRYYDVKRLGRP